MIVEDLEFSEEISKDKFIKIHGCGSWDFKFNTTLDPKSIADIDIHLEFQPESLDTDVSSANALPIHYLFYGFGYPDPNDEYSVITTSSLDQSS